MFTSSDEVKRKDCVRELHPQIYPFTEEDGKTEPFKGKLDFSAFTFPEENTSLISEQAQESTLEVQEESYAPPYKEKGAFHTSLPEEIRINEDLGSLIEEVSESIVSEAEAISEENVSKVTGVCIKCQACIKICPAHAKYFVDEAFLSHVEMLENTYTERKEPTFIITN